jgi:glyoxylase-like metal-dependent hydrolase (beta-lactamase superfamily II)
MPQAQFRPMVQATLRRRSFLGASAIGLGAIGMWPELQTFAADAKDFVMGPPVKDIPPIQVSKHVWMIFAPDGFPTQENRGMMSNVSFVVTAAGVVILDSGSSLQIGQMAIRMIKKVTPLPVIAVFNSHFHGDHWLGNHAFVEEYGIQLPIYALAKTIETIKGMEGNTWRILMERWTNQSTVGTKTVAPNRVVTHGQKLKFGDLDFVMHHYGRAHTDADLSVQVVQDRVTSVGDIAMANRIANIDDGSYLGTFKYYKALTESAGEQIWLPGHGQPAKDLLQTYGEFMAGIWEPCLQAVKDAKSEAEAKAMVLKDPRVQKRAKNMQGFDGNIGKYVSLAYLEAEKEAF